MNTAAISRILNVREREKKTAEKSYQYSIEIFEEIATKLYKELKRKEQAEVFYERFLQTSTSIDVIKEQSLFIGKLTNQIVKLQLKVQEARRLMDLEQDKLAEAHIEVKKIEKIMEHRHDDKMKEIQKIERATMDEISISQFLNHKTGIFNG